MLMTVVKMMMMLVKVAVWLQQEGVPVEQVEEHCPALPSLENLVPYSLRNWNYHKVLC